MIAKHNVTLFLLDKLLWMCRVLEFTNLARLPGMIPSFSGRIFAFLQSCNILPQFLRFWSCQCRYTEIEIIKSFESFRSSK